ncbi:MAG: 4Fe-4S dicluster domain-containing protein [Desulfatiglandales bacterium]
MIEITVDNSKCNGCEDCVDACSASVFSMVGGKAKPVNPGDCIECCACVDICEQAAIDHESCLL